LIGKDEGNVGSYATTVIKNLTWPGATTVATTKSYSNIYVGYGLKVN